MSKKLLSRIMAVMLALVMVMGMSVTVMADTGVTTGTSESAVSSVSISKTVTTDGNTYAPNTTFSFNITTGEATSYTDNDTTYSVKAGISSGLSIASDITSSPTAGSVSESYTYSTSITVNASSFTSVETGVYHYVLTETSGSYDGIVYDKSQYEVYVFVYQSSTGTNYVGNVVCVKSKDADGQAISSPAKADLSFTNNYGKNTASGGSDDPGDTTHDLTITKVVSGAMAEVSRYFTFSVTVTGVDGELYKVETTSTSTSQASVSYLTSGTSQTFYLKSGETIKIYGLSSTDSVAITESGYSDYGYTPFITTATNVSGVTATGTTSSADSKNTATVKVTADEAAITFTNVKDSTTPTGILLTYGPYALMVIIALAACVVFFRRRRTTLD